MKKTLLTIIFCLISSIAFAVVSVPDTVKDEMLDRIKTTAVTLHIVTDVTLPIDISNSIGSVTIDSSDFTYGSGGISGRKCVLSAQDVPITSPGTAHFYILLNAAGDIRLIGTVTDKTLDANQTYRLSEKNLLEIPNP